jgi:hypothetical protein
MSVDTELSGTIAAMQSRAEASALQGHRSLEAAFMQCAMVLLDAAYEDGVELDTDALGAAFGVVYDC